MTVSVIYEFTRSDGVDGFMKTNRSSTDAKGLVETWEQGAPGRKAEVLFDEDSQTGNMRDKLVARLTTSEADIDANPGALDDLCSQFGLSRQVVSYP
jgi:hypothetical protein